MCSLMGGGAYPATPKPLTREQMKAATDNPYENPDSGVSAPSWKPEEVKKEKAAREAAREALKAKETPRTEGAETVPRSSGSGGVVAKNKRNAARKKRAKENRQAKKNTDARGRGGARRR